MTKSLSRPCGHKFVFLVVPKNRTYPGDGPLLLRGGGAWRNTKGLAGAPSTASGLSGCVRLVHFSPMTQVLILSLPFRSRASGRKIFAAHSRSSAVWALGLDHFKGNFSRGFPMGFPNKHDMMRCSPLGFVDWFGLLVLPHPYP